MFTCEFLIFINQRSNDATKPADKKLTFTQELVQYKIALNRDREIGFSKFWLENNSIFPILNTFVLEYSIISASSVPSESTFSESGHLQNKQRSSLDPQKLQYSMFLKNSDDVLNSFKKTNSAD
jgi:hypothetical protein